ncbi:unnamed protein product [Vicia faba]|uniref:Uncharacterized protein n=1 Tax=Vicia faba TaxID=3906 RepID=A0AAV0ZTH6_VICFA|nr:unnamed protein product [Vicia faba]
MRKRWIDNCVILRAQNIENLAYARGIGAMMNTGISFLDPTLVLVSYPTQTVATLSPLLENLPEGDKIEMAYEVAYSMFKVASIFYSISTGHDDVPSPDSPLKERDT